MFKIVEMTFGSKDYLPSLVYLWGKKSKKKKRAAGDESSDDDFPDIDPDADGVAFGNVEEYSEELPGAPPGRWAGGGAAFLGLSGEIEKEQYERIFRGYHPSTGEPLVQNAGSPDRRPGFEGCYTVLKPCSVLVLGARKEWREIMLEAIREVPERLVKMIEERFAFSRAGKASKGCKYVRVRLVVGVWEHLFSRCLNENIHYHLQLFNLGVDEDGNVRALEPRFIFKNQKIITAWADALLVSILQEKFGLIVERRGSTYHIRGVPEDLVEAKSQRSHQIRAYMAEHGLSGGKDADYAAKATRPPKDTSKSRAEVIADCQAYNATVGFDYAYIDNLLRNARCRPSAAADRSDGNSPAASEPVKNADGVSAPETAAAAVAANPPDTVQSPETVHGPPARETTVPNHEALPSPTSVNPPACQPSPPSGDDSPSLAADNPSPTIPATDADFVAPQSDIPHSEFAAYSSLAANNPQVDALSTDTGSFSSDANDSSVGEPGDISTVSGNPPETAHAVHPTFSSTNATPSARKRNPRAARASRRLIRKAIRKAARRRNHFSEDELILYTLRRLTVLGLDPGPVFDEVARYLHRNRNVVPLDIVNGWRRYTTKQILREERRMLAATERLSSRSGHRVSDKKLAAVFKQYPDLSQEQLDFIRYMTQHNSAFRIGLGPAGGGKTYVIKVILAAFGWDCRPVGHQWLSGIFRTFRRRRRRVYLLSPTGQSAEVLATDTGFECQTVTRFTADYLLPFFVLFWCFCCQLWRAARGLPTRRVRQPRPKKLKRGSIVLVDEAGMKNTVLARKTLEMVADAHATCLLVGDPSQLPSVEGTPPLHALVRRYGATEIKTIRRQKEPWAREAARKFSEGKIGEALVMFRDHKQITVRDDIDEAVRQACLDWTEEGLTTPHRALILSNLNEIVHKANLIAQEHRLRAGCIQPSPSIRITDEQDEAVYESRAFRGDRIVCTRNSPAPPWGYGVKNGSRGTIIEINSFTSEIAVLLDGKKKRYVKINVRKYPHIRLGYAVTTYKSQSASLPTIYAIVGGKGQNFPASYVQATRAIEQTRFYTTSDFLDSDLEHVASSRLAKQMSRKPDLTLAVDHLDNAPLDLRPRKRRIRKAAEQRPRKELSMIYHKMPSIFYIVTVPTRDARLSDILFTCDIDSFFRRVMDGLRSDQIFGVYDISQKAAAIADARKLLKSAPNAQGHSPLKCVGFPATFIVATMPSSASLRDTVHISCDLKKLAHYIMAGMTPEGLLGIYAEEKQDIAIADTICMENMLERAADSSALLDDPPTEYSGFPSKLWLVTKPSSPSATAGVSPCHDLMEFIRRVMDGLRPDDIVGAYAQRQAALAAATSLTSDLSVGRSGLPLKFWLVTTPTSVSQTTADICLECRDLKDVARYVMAGLRPEGIIGVYDKPGPATTRANELLQLARKVRDLVALESLPVPSRFWLVTRPTPSSKLADVCFECDFSEFARRVKDGLRPCHIYGVYAHKQDADAAATSLLNSMPLPSPTLLFGQEHPPFKYVGFPSVFWLVTMPTPESQMDDICRDCDLADLAVHYMTPLQPRQIIGIFPSKKAAIPTASRLLQIVRPSDASRNTVPVPSRFWVVTKPTPHTSIRRMCMECDFKSFGFEVLFRGLRPENIVGIYAEKSAAVAAASKAIVAMNRSAIAQVPTTIEIVGLPPTLWFVRTPTPTSQLNDICRECQFQHLSSLFLDGLSPDQIVGVYADKQTANTIASKLLQVVREIHGLGDQKASLRTPESLSAIDWDRLRTLGFTEDYREAGFVDPTGRMIDLSGKNDGACPGHRYLDHREAGGTLGMQQLMAAGYIRFFPESFGAQMAESPTEDQLARLCGFAAQNHGDILIEAHNGWGPLARDGEYYMNPTAPEDTFYKVYPKGTRPEWIANDIRRFYNARLLASQKSRVEDVQNECSKNATNIDAVDSSSGTDRKDTTMNDADPHAKEVAAKLPRRPIEPTLKTETIFDEGILDQGLGQKRWTRRFYRSSDQRLGSADLGMSAAKAAPVAASSSVKQPSEATPPRSLPIHWLQLAWRFAAKTLSGTIRRDPIPHTAAKSTPAKGRAAKPLPKSARFKGRATVIPSPAPPAPKATLLSRSTCRKPSPTPHCDTAAPSASAVAGQFPPDVIHDLAVTFFRECQLRTFDDFVEYLTNNPNIAFELFNRNERHKGAEFMKRVMQQEDVAKHEKAVKHVDSTFNSSSYSRPIVASPTPETYTPSPSTMPVAPSCFPLSAQSQGSSCQPDLSQQSQQAMIVAMAQAWTEQQARLTPQTAIALVQRNG